jgi:cupin 2 domain-containing protein
MLRGRLDEPSAGPETGERSTRVLELRNLVVEQILSGRLDGPVDYDPEQDEWVLLLAGHASVAVGGETVELVPGDWLFLPARLPHRLVETAPGTSWLVVHLHPNG